MKVAVLGTGAVGQTMSARLVTLGHEVFMGTRDVSHSLERKDTDAWGTPGIGTWIEEHPQVSLMTFREAVEHGEDLILLAINGMNVLSTLKTIPKSLLQEKILIDQSNPLDFSGGFPPLLSVCNTESLGEQIQNTYPGLKVVKTLNTVSSQVMASPEILPGDHVIFLCGDDAEAKASVTALLESMGWKTANIIDLGKIEASRGTEMLLPLWTRLMGKFQSPAFNINIVKAQAHPA